MSERVFHDWLSKRLAKCNDTVIIGAGHDDCGHVDVSGLQALAFSTDTVVEGTHFDAEADPLNVGYKAVAAALSDLAASGCRPLWGLVALNMRRGLGDRWAMRLMEGIVSCAQMHNLSIIGGDTTSAYGPTSVNITVGGTPYGKEAIMRAGVSDGDLLIVTGELGGSILGKHMKPIPRFAEIEKLIELVPVKSCMDITDGLTMDLSRMLAVSNFGAILEEAEIPISEDAFALSKKTMKTPMEHALSDGEDFELLFSVSEEAWGILQKEWPKTGIKTKLSCIGRIENNQGLRVAGSDGTLHMLDSAGYEHNF